MKIIIGFAVIAMALLGAISSIDAMPQRHTAHGPLGKPSRFPQRPMRFRRQVLGGKVVSNPAGGADARMELAKGFGTPDDNAIVSAFAAGNTQKGPVASGGSLAFNYNDHGLELTKEHIPGVRDSFTQSAHANLFGNEQNKLNAKVFASQNELANGFKFDRNGGGLEWAHKNGHEASAMLSNFPGIGQKFDLGAKANLWSSADRNTRFDLTGGASKWLSGPFSGQSNLGGGLGLSHSFG